MGYTENHRTGSGPGAPGKSRRAVTIVAIVAALVVFAAAGVKTGSWLSGRHASDARYRQIDDLIGLGERTGMTGGLVLQAVPGVINVRAGQPAGFDLVLTNRTARTVLLNKWFEPLPADYASNQLPVKVIVSRNGRVVPFRGGNVLFPAHTPGDFVALGAGKSIRAPINLPHGAGRGAWDMSVPGVYVAEVWYETYLTGRHIGVKAWTGMTNHAIVRISVAGPMGSRR